MRPRQAYGTHPYACPVAAPTVTTANSATGPAANTGQSARTGRGTVARLLASTGGGVLLYASFAPRPLWWLAPVSFALLGLTLHGRRARAGYGYGLAFGIGFFVPLLAWTGSYVGVIAWWPLAAAEAAVLAAGAAGIAVVTKLPAWPVSAALLWVADEAVRARVPFGGFPWGKVAFGQSDGGYLSLAALGGTPLVGFAVTLTGFGLAAVILSVARHDRRRIGRVLAATAAVAAPIAASILAWPVVGTDPNAGTATVAVIQGNVPRLGLDFNAQRRAVLDYHVTETEKLAVEVNAGTVPRPQLVIWPENSSDIDPYANPDAFAEISAAVADINAPTEIGAVVTSQGQNPKNTAILWLPGQGPVEQYVKRKLQPFGETMPMRSLFRLFTSYVDRAGNFMPGAAPVVFPMGPAKVALDTCYEVAFDDVVRASIPGSTLLAVPTNNATFGKTDMTYQQLAMDQVRAVEHGRSVVVAATSGVSAIIAPNGTVTQRTRLFTPAALVATVPLRSTTTLADQVGDWPEWTMAGLGVAVLGLAIGIRACQTGARRRGAADRTDDETNGKTTAQQEK